MGDTVPRPSIHDLPHEMLEQLLQYIPTSDLLFNCRLVCQVWSELATTICGNREVIVNPPSTHLDYFSEDGFRYLFMTPTSIRWTGIELEFTDSPQVKAFNTHLCEDFGTRILYLSATIQSSTQSDFFDALGQMPNLQNLHICLVDGGGPYIWEEDEYEPFTFPQDGEIELLQLKKLRLSNLIIEYGETYELLECLLLRTGAQLESLDLPYLNGEVMSSDLGDMAQLLCIADIPNLSLKLFYHGHSDQFYDLMGRQQFRIHSLEIEFSSRLYSLSEDSTFRPLERFLKNSVGLTILRLGHFEYIGSIMSNVVSRFLQSIMLPDLKTLGMTLHYDDTNSGHENPMFTVHPVRSASFPNLKKFDLLYLPSDQESLDIQLIFKPNTFNKVKYLKVDYQENGQGIRGMFSSIFRNTANIRARIRSLGQISSILKGMKHVTKLYLQLVSINEDELLCEAVEYIGPLKTLRVLTLDVSSSTESKLELSQIGALALMQLRPLSLIIYGSKLKNSDAAVSNLRKYHFGVQILPTSVKR